MNTVELENQTIQLSPAACDPVKIWFLGYSVAEVMSMNGLKPKTGPRLVIWVNRDMRRIGTLWEAHVDDGDPQDIGQETFSTDTLVGGLPDD